MSFSQFLFYWCCCFIGWKVGWSLLWISLSKIFGDRVSVRLSYISHSIYNPGEPPRLYREPASQLSLFMLQVMLYAAGIKVEPAK